MDTAALPRIAISMGDPAGIGPEVALKAAADSAIRRQARIVIVGDSRILQETAAQMGLPMPDCVAASADSLPDAASAAVLEAGNLNRAEFQPGRLSAACGQAAADYIRQAVRLCLEGAADALTTGPVNKEAVTQAGIPFTGHTEYIAALCGAGETRMLLVNDRLRVVHVTTHCRLQDACRASAARIHQTIALGRAALRALGFAEPRIAVCGLNPHAGEHGLFGSEDAERIAPAVRAAQAAGILCDGPLPADTLFVQAARGKYDLVVAMYHDQGHIPMKLLDFEHTVNVSLGLPIIRTSVDHGTAFDIVGQNRADPASMKAALQLAATLAKHCHAA